MSAVPKPPRTERRHDRLRRFWRRRDVLVVLSLLLLALLLRRPFLLLVPGTIAAVALFRPLYARILDSVRAKLMAFYLYAALLPFLLILCVLLFVGYVVLGHGSAQVVERRLEALSTWMERRGDQAEAAYWRERAAGTPPERAAVRALQTAFAATDSAPTAWWVLGANEVPLASAGAVGEFGPLEPGWLRGRSFAGLVVAGSRLELRLHSVFPGSGGRLLRLGAALPLTSELLAREPPEAGARVHGGLGDPGRPLAAPAGSDSSPIAAGILAWVEPRTTAADTASGGVTASQRQMLERVAAKSAFPALLWDYRGHPVDWVTGRTEASGPPISIAFSLEGATRALLRTSFETLGAVAIVVLVVCGLIVLLQLVATFRGFAYARAIAAAVSRLDAGVRALRAGNFGTRIQPKERDQLGRLALAFNDMSQQLQALLQQRAEHESVERELAMARSVQRRLFPESLPQVPYLEASGICLPARLVSGDYYDFIPFAGGTDVVIADVSGKGMSAALLMASVQAALRSQYPLDGQPAPDPGTILARLNHHLHATLEPTRFVTLFLLRILEDGRVLYGNAGHNPALLLRGERAEWLQAGGLLLGPFAAPRFESTALRASSGDVLCLYTDGVTEAEGAEGEHFGEERLATVLRAGRHLPPEALQESIVGAVRAWQGEQEPTDDITLVLLRLKR